MHHCLIISEILLKIFDFLYDDDPCRRAPLARLALTCRTFHDPASELLWSYLPSLHPLVKCLPVRVRETFEGLEWYGPPVLFASLVRSLSLMPFILPIVFAPDRC
jgi:F-box-like